MAEIHGLTAVMIEKSLDVKVDDWPESGLKRHGFSLANQMIAVQSRLVLELNIPGSQIGWIAAEYVDFSTPS